MEINAKYDSQQLENKWYEYWLEQKFFESKPNEKLPYTIVIPPPNVTGVLHMGHMLNNTIQDVLIRRARMLGFNALWVPGTDHASIATEAKVVALLAQKGIKKQDLSREEFLKHAWEWKEKHGGIILQQLRKLGASCDWSRTKFTMDDDMSEAVINVFIDLYNKGKIYRGVRMVNWDPSALTAISDEEVIYQEVKSKLYYIKYKIEGCDEYISVATTRPETILGDTAVCVHPEDERYVNLKGKRVIVPVVHRSVPVIFDEYVDREFGTGALKITPAHDVNDYHLGIKHKLEIINTFNDDGTLSEAAQFLVGMDRFEAREAILPLLKDDDCLLKTEDYVNKVGFSERTNVAIEPKLSLQWFLKMDEMAKPALEAVVTDNIRFFPEKYKNTYAHWMSNIKDWCISRQLWWGHRIPAYYLPNQEFIVAKSKEEALKTAQELFPELNLTIEQLKQDEDVMDTWFSSWLWPLSLFDGIRNPDNEEINYYYPTTVLVTAPEIIFFWVARMIMAGIEYKHNIPFKDVYFTGIVRDHLRRKMSKSLGNSPDPLDLMKKYGADGVRFGMLLSSPAGNDLLFDESLCEQGHFFNNKIWNAFRLLKGWEKSNNILQPKHTQIAIEWMNQRIRQVSVNLTNDFEKYRLSETLMSVYKLIWDDFCSCFLEIVKPPYQKPMDEKSYTEIVSIFEKLMLYLHPFMPFITEEIWQNLSERKTGESVMIQKMPNYTNFDEDLLSRFEKTQKIVEEIRRIRSQKNIPQKNPLELIVVTQKEQFENQMDAVISKLCNIEKITYSTEKPTGAVSFIQNNTEYFIPILQNINKEEELEKLKTDLKYTEGFLATVLKKLSNEKFTTGAPEQVVALERKKQADAEAKITLLKKQIEALD
jgi:valyl-tRNA synthetase